MKSLFNCLSSPVDIHLDLVFGDAEDVCYFLIGFSFDVSKLQTATLLLGQFINDVPYDVQLVFLNARERWQELDSIEAYSLTIARNLSIDRIKKMDNQNDSLEEQTTERLDETSSTPSERMIQKDKLNIVRNIINELPEKQRSCLQLRDIEGKSYKEIADILSITEDQVKVNIFRARQTVKQRFQQFDSYGL